LKLLEKRFVQWQQLHLANIIDLTSPYLSVARPLA
jgi:hypothetical protein